MTTKFRLPKLPRLLRMVKNPGRSASRQIRTTQRKAVRGALGQAGAPRPVASRIPRLINKLTKGGFGKSAPEEEITSATLESLATDDEDSESGGLGASTIVERSHRLERQIQQEKGDVGRVLFRANTLAIVTRGSLLSRIWHKLKIILLAPLALIAALLAMGNGSKPGRLNKPVLVVDGTGRVTLFKDGRIRTPYLGVNLREKQLDESLHLLMRDRHVMTTKGFRVTTPVSIASRAYRAGIHRGDIVVAFQKKLVEGKSLPSAQYISAEPQIALVRDGRTIEMTLGPSEQGDRWPGFGYQPAVGLRPAQVTIDRDVVTQSGIEVTGVHAGGPAELASVKRGDVLLAADEILLDSHDALRMAMDPRMIKSKTAFRLWRPGTVEGVSLLPAKDGQSIESYLGMSYRFIKFPSALHATIDDRWLTLHFGILIVRPQPGGGAENAGLAYRDVILALDGAAIENEDQVGEHLAAAAEREREVVIHLQSGALMRLDVTPLERTPELVKNFSSDGSTDVPSRSWS